MFCYVKYSGETGYHIVESDKIRHFKSPIHYGKRYKVQCGDKYKNAVIAFVEEKLDDLKLRIEKERPKVLPLSLVVSASNITDYEEKLRKQRTLTDKSTLLEAKLAAMRESATTADNMPDKEIDRGEPDERGKRSRRKKSSNEAVEKRSRKEKNGEKENNEDKSPNEKSIKRSRTVLQESELKKKFEQDMAQLNRAEGDSSDRMETQFDQLDPSIAQINNAGLLVEPPLSLPMSLHDAPATSRQTQPNEVLPLSPSKSFSSVSSSTTASPAKSTCAISLGEPVEKDVPQQTIAIKDSTPSGPQITPQQSISPSVELNAITGSLNMKPSSRSKQGSEPGVPKPVKKNLKISSRSNKRKKERSSKKRDKTQSKKSQKKGKDCGCCCQELKELVTHLSRECQQSRELVEKLLEHAAATKVSLETVENNWKQLHSSREASGVGEQDIHLEDITKPPLPGFIRNDGYQEKIHCGQNVWVLKVTYDNAVYNARTDRIFMKNMALAIFGDEALKNSSVTGTSSNRTKSEPKPQLDSTKALAVRDIYAFFLESHRRYEQGKIKELLADYLVYIRQKISDMNRVTKPKAKKNETRNSTMTEDTPRKTRSRSSASGQSSGSSGSSTSGASSTSGSSDEQRAA